MQRKFPLLLAFLFVGFATCLAQTASLNGSFASASNGDNSGLLALNDGESIYSDAENQVFYIDFERLSMNLSDIVVRRHDGEIILKEDVFELPVNTIYEIDFSQFGAGNYEIELRSFTGVLRRSVSIR